MLLIVLAGLLSLWSLTEFSVCALLNDKNIT